MNVISKSKVNLSLAAAFMLCSIAAGQQYHVSKDGSDSNEGFLNAPFKTISAAAKIAQPGDVITVHEGVYRERINPPRGGESNKRRIVYQAAAGEDVVIKGSERVTDWEKVQNDTWKITKPNSFFGGFNPYDDLISGDWFDARGREHHTGAVYLNGHWLTEASEKSQVLQPVKKQPIWAYRQPSSYLLNVNWIKPEGGEKIPAADFSTQHGVRKEPASQGGQCIAFIQHGDWARYDVDFGENAGQITFGAASDTTGGLIEIRLDSPEGKLLGTADIPNTAGWQSWDSFTARIKPVSGNQTICLVFLSSGSKPVKNPLWSPEMNSSNSGLWYAEVSDSQTTIWAQFKDVNPNREQVEINVRQTVFYPEKPGRNYITVRGFKLMHAATPWAPPTAEQIGLIGTHWSKGWLIENNQISYSTCTGVTLGKYGDKWDNTSQDTAVGYVQTIKRAKDNGWEKNNIGHHTVRKNTISHCEQAGLVGSLGAVFSTIKDNEIHDIHVRQLFSGAEMAGIKLHAPIDCLISDNHIYRTARGMWLDWMTQGTRVTRNLFHDNDVYEDLFVEVNHGPFVVDNNILLSRRAFYDNSQGGAYVHNLFAGEIFRSAEFNRETPYHKPHSTEIAGLSNIKNGDNRFYNNIFIGGDGLASYDKAILPVYMGGNVFLNGAEASESEENPIVLQDFDPELKLSRDDSNIELAFPESAVSADTMLITTEILGRTEISDLPYLDCDGSNLKVDTDYLKAQRSKGNPTPGPFEEIKEGDVSFKVR
ncbi:carbohydrate-binding protein [Sedimentisphaera salicampi]|uniref:Arabinoxylan arabinofuranohydrolase n=1 Tax=Sedimentisphaera salicampi TaxID=1941349 RepID=A0A1W6LKD4_9BACT|nr:carbohydrate-binding protein [Sedimentisphaera salicampi]ARN56258.1 Arabinoxylan arabinofuranohydrolase precursor [Sedimentisphaera salicampi]